MNLLDTFDGRKYLFPSLRVVVEWCKFHLFSWSVKRSISFIRFKTFSSFVSTRGGDDVIIEFDTKTLFELLLEGLLRHLHYSSATKQAQRKIDKWALPKSDLVQCWGVILTMSTCWINYKLMISAGSSHFIQFSLEIFIFFGFVVSLPLHHWKYFIFLH